METSADDAAELGEEVFDARAASFPGVALRHQVAVQLLDHVPDGDLVDAEILGAVVRRIQDGIEADTGAFVQKPPEQAGYVREHTLGDQYERYPLVVPDTLRGSLVVQPFARYGRIHVEEVGAADPAYGLRVVHVALLELSRTPAVDRPADELLRADQEGKQDGQYDRVLPAQTIHVVVVNVELEVTDAQDGLEQTIHRAIFKVLDVFIRVQPIYSFEYN